MIANLTTTLDTETFPINLSLKRDTKTNDFDSARNRIESLSVIRILFSLKSKFESWETVLENLMHIKNKS